MSEVIPPEVLQVALEQSFQSVCLSQRGSVIWTENDRSHPTILGKGYNRHVGLGCTRDAVCKANCCDKAVHAEQVALMDALWNSLHMLNKFTYALHAKTVNEALVPSGPPSCEECSKMLLASPLRIHGVYLYHEPGWVLYPMKQFHYLSEQNAVNHKLKHLALH
jgi:deoxycytidylate deaminase